MKNEKKLVIHYKNGKTRVITDELDYNITAHEYVIKMLKSMFKDKNPICLLETKNDVIVILNKYDITEITVSKENDQLEITELITNKAEPIEIEEVNSIMDELVEDEEVKKEVAKKEVKKETAKKKKAKKVEKSDTSIKSDDVLPADEFYKSPSSEVPQSPKTKTKTKKTKKRKKNTERHLVPLDADIQKTPDIKKVQPNEFIKPIPLDLQVENILKNESAEDGVFIDSIKDKNAAPNIVEITKK